MNQQKNPTKKWISLLIILILLGGLVAFLISKRVDVDDTVGGAPELMENAPVDTMNNVPAAETPVPTDAPKTDAVATPPETNVAAAYKDGTYHATGSYRSPGGSESVDVQLSLKNGVVTDVSMNLHPSGLTSSFWMKKFETGMNQAVVGKKIDDLNLRVVSGSSLTPIGFMDALKKIQVEAKA